MIELNDEAQLRQSITDGKLKEMRHLIRHWPASDLAHLIGELPLQEGIIAFRLLLRDLAAHTFEFLEPETQQALIEALAHEQECLVSMANELAPDDHTALLEELPGQIAANTIMPSFTSKSGICTNSGIHASSAANAPRRSCRLLIWRLAKARV